MVKSPAHSASCQFWRSWMNREALRPTFNSIQRMHIIKDYTNNLSTLPSSSVELKHKHKTLKQTERPGDKKFFEVSCGFLDGLL
ncbi:hypothetical protein Pmani_017588 [Petrolisthes manimaculis]|uniref:Uncharacterized protein n=1 Tax=Petrolisthes manimaculis TaxID=1843537 RepID=A0AAE1U5N0_9EUCA|nr:hypothetical protein Pmani_017588 [Petrolisthes manimaculis]